MKNPITAQLQDVIIEMCAKRFDLSVEDFVSQKNNKQDNVLRRYMAYHLIKKNTFLSYEAVGGLFGCCNESAVRHGCNRINDYLSYDKRVITEIKNLQEMINNFNEQKEKSFLSQWLTQ
jgi:chromosomal replication initiation ATPase DnaA